MYTAVRVIVGVFLVFRSFLSTVDFNGFLDRIDSYFEKVTVFNFQILYYTAPLVPFEEFTLGILIALGLHTKIVLKISLVLFSYFAFFMLDAGIYDKAVCHSMITILIAFLFYYRRFNLKSMDHEIRSQSLL